MRLTSVTRNLTIAGTFAAALAMAPAAQAGLVTNGGFETGNLTGWTLSNDDGFNGVCADGDIVAAIHTCASNSGTYAFTFGQISSDGVAALSQDLSTAAGKAYTLTFYIEFEDDTDSPTNTLAVLWDGGTVYFTTDVAISGYSKVVLTGLLASGPTTTLEFDGTNDPTQTYLDDVSVTTPEPATLLLFGAGLAGLGARRRKAKA